MCYLELVLKLRYLIEKQHNIVFLISNNVMKILYRNSLAKVYERWYSPKDVLTKPTTWIGRSVNK